MGNGEVGIRDAKAWDAARHRFSREEYKSAEEEHCATREHELGSREAGRFATSMRRVASSLETCVSARSMQLIATSSLPLAPFTKTRFAGYKNIA